MATRQEQYDATRAAILQAGKELLSKYEAKEIKIKDIMGACQLSPGLFYHYYKSKDQFLMALESETWAAGNTILADPEKTPLERLKVYCFKTILNELGVNPQLRRNLLSYKMTNQYIKERDRFWGDDANLKWLCKFFEEGIKEGAFSPDMPVEYISRLLVYVIHGVIYNAALYNREADSIDWVEEFCNHYLENTILGPYLLPQKS